ncbi:CadC-family transcriptional regulator [Vineibacter terrae]|uniref:CadC-family transcriptional regulator n=1 Tax=Vineibacter terrae TaxID=2586908 RepID=A0A5C8PCZ1_9HYPH|nr:winged helix-turn-helix domain-containing protein [Vineibacter terrae]TXL71377.1 CadC-family transcriptional regulator [Vineibacter terrae]
MQYAFEDYVLDPERRELTRGAATVAVGPKVFDLLVYLVQHRDRVVSKDDLLDAVWDGRIVSESTLTSHINAVRRAIGDSGEAQRLIRTVARKGFRFVGDIRDLPAQDGGSSLATEPAGSTEISAPVLALPDKPSIAVLAFQNLSGDPEQEYFADGVVEDIVTALSRHRWLFVIARNSSFVYKGRAVDLKEVGRELGVRYVLEGSVRKAANRVRITGQLVSAATGTNLWTDRFESALDDIFELQDQLAQSVVAAIAPRVERAEIQRALRKPTDNLGAYDYYLRGMASFHQATSEGISAALALFYRAIELDPAFASAYGMAAWCLYWRKMNGWIRDRVRDYAEGARLANRAIELGASDAVALTRGGHALAHFGGDLDKGIAAVDRALVLNPNLTIAWYLSGFQRISCGEPDDAVERFARAMRLSPLDPETFQMQTGTAMAHMFAGRFDMASAWAEKASRELPDVLRVFAFGAASHALAGRMDDARRAMQHVRRLAPALRLADVEDWVVLRRPEDLDTFVEGLRRAGLPA